MKAATKRRSEAPMNTELAISADALCFDRSIGGLNTRLNARDRKIIGTTIRALQRLLENDGVTPAHQEDQRAQLIVRDGRIMLLAAVSTQAAFGDIDEDSEPVARPYRLPPLQTRQPRAFAFG
jgi:hypothetical protein